MSTTGAVTLSYLSPYKHGSPSSVTKDLETSNIATKIVHDSTFMSYIT